MKTLLLMFALLLVCACSSAERTSHEIRWQGETHTLKQPLLVFDVVKIPRAGVAADVAGKVEILHEGKEWLPVTDGSELVDGSRLHVAAGAALVVRFAPTERIEFLAAPNERWVVLQVVGGR